MFKLRNCYLPVLSLLIALPLISATATAQTDAAEDEAIRATVLNYIEGWYEGDVERMDTDVHPDLVKRIVFTDPRSSRSMYNQASKTHMLEYTRAGMGKKDAADKEKISMEILAQDAHIAMVKSITPQFIDYIHLAKWNDEWKIVNVLWIQNAQGE